MKVKSIHYHSALLTKGAVRERGEDDAGNGSVRQEGAGNPPRKKSAGLCVENQRNIAAKSGSFTRKSETAALSFKGKGDFFAKAAKSKWFNGMLEYMDKHNVIASATAALVFASVLRPATILGFPSKKNKEDRAYASAHSVSSGILGFLFSFVISSPLDIAIDKIKKAGANGDWSNCQSLGKLKAPQREALITMVKMLPDWTIAIPRAMLTIALIPYILKYVFGLEKKSKKAAADVKPAHGGVEPAAIPIVENKPADNKSIPDNIKFKEAFKEFNVRRAA